MTATAAPAPRQRAAQRSHGEVENGQSSTQPSGGGGGRDANGRFTKGNAGGPGNPFARQTARATQRAQSSGSRMRTGGYCRCAYSAGAQRLEQLSKVLSQPRENLAETMQNLGSYFPWMAKKQQPQESDIVREIDDLLPRRVR